MFTHTRLVKGDMARNLQAHRQVMSKKLKIPGVARETRAEASASIRRGPVRPGLYLLELRQHAANNSPPRRRLMINIDGPDREDAPKPVKITFA